jgi:hypothetical protein
MPAWGAVLLALWLCVLLVFLTAPDGPGIGDLHTILRRVNGSRSERALVDKRAGVLLRELLTDHEYDQLVHRGYVDVASPSQAQRLYRIPRDGRRVRVFEDGKPQHDLCVGPVAPLPSQDLILLHKLMIQGDEQAYLARANRIPIGLW